MPFIFPSSEKVRSLALIMILCLLVYRLAEWCLRAQLAATDQTVPNQLKQLTTRPTMRWMFESFEGISVLALPGPTESPYRAPFPGLRWVLAETVP